MGQRARRPALASLEKIQEGVRKQGLVGGKNLKILSCQCFLKMVAEEVEEMRHVASIVNVLGTAETRSWALARHTQHLLLP